MKQLFLAVAFLLLLNSCSYGQGTTPAIRKVNIVMAAIENLYVDTINGGKLAEDAIVGLLEKLDPHSSYSTPEEVKELNEPLQGNFEGIGVQFNMLTDTLYIVQVIPGGPSEKVGILAGDRIIYVEDTLIAGVSKKNNDIIKMLRGPKGTIVNVKILRNKNPQLLDFRITRDKIPIYSLDAAYMLDKKTGYIKLNRFASTSYDEFKGAMKKLQDQGMENLIFDLQGNGGGYMNAAIEIANEFLKQGSLIVYTEGVHQRREEAMATYKGSLTKGRLIVLVDESSASASEIVSGAIQDWDRGLIVGRRTFGKGLVQRPIPLPDGSMIRLTTARYYTPTGRSIQKPYENGDSESYNMEVIGRYNHGELISADSIHFPDSLKYYTLTNKRIVYGGGGIMPDYFVPLDTTKLTKIHREISGAGLISKYTMQYVDENRNKILNSYKTFSDYKSKFAITESMLNDLLKMYKEERLTTNRNDWQSEELITENGIVIKEEPKKGSTASPLTQKDLDDFETSKSLIRMQIKAYIASDLYDRGDFYEIINDINDPLKKALEIINNSEEYSKLLEGK